jgi:glycosyltransferase involved in cell wall biosynthesis
MHRDSGVSPRRGRGRHPGADDLVMLAANSSFALTNYRLGLLRALQNAGYRLVAAVPDDAGVSKLAEEGVEVRFVQMQPHGTSALRELQLLKRYIQLARELRPRALLGFTIKPNIYGALAGRIAGVPVINNVTGLGVVFTRGGLLRHVVGTLYRIAFRGSYRVFFQNEESRDLFLAHGYVRENQTAILPGSGIDLQRFAPGPRAPATERPGFTFLLPSRLIWQKGIGEYCAAARWFASHRRGVRFQLLGGLEPSSHRGAIPREQIERWEADGVEYLGATDDVRPFLDAADCIVLPSYYPEGVPRALIEASAMGKPVITTDTPGCRDVVDPGETGFLCEPRSVESLVQAMVKMVDQPREERLVMGSRARLKMERQFDEQLVIDAYLAAIDGIVVK